MSEDVAIDLIADVNQAFQTNCIKDRSIERLSKKLDAGTATYADAYRFGTAIGNARAKAFKSQVSSAVLPNGRMYYNIASRLMEDTLTRDYELVSQYAVGVQTIANTKNKLAFKALKADKSEDRIKGFIDRLSQEEVYDEVAWILDEPVKVHALSVVDDTIKKNAEFQSRVGLKVEVIRTSEAKCCDWCSDLAGSYTYPGVPGDVFARHDNCRCTIDYNGSRLSSNGHSYR